MAAIDKNAVCGRFFSAVSNPDQRQLAVLMDTVGHLTPEELKRYKSDAAALAKIPLNHQGATALSQVLKQMDTKTSNFTAQQRGKLTKELGIFFETDC